MFGIRVERHGGPEVLEWAAVEDPAPGPGDLVVDLAFAGLNFIDVYQRTGLYPMELSPAKARSTTRSRGPGAESSTAAHSSTSGPP